MLRGLDFIFRVRSKRKNFSTENDDLRFPFYNSIYKSHNNINQPTLVGGFLCATPCTDCFMYSISFTPCNFSSDTDISFENVGTLNRY